MGVAHFPPLTSPNRWRARFWPQNAGDEYFQHPTISDHTTRFGERVVSCHRKIRGSGHRKVRECGTPVSHTMAHEARACHTLKTPSPIQCHRRIRGRGIPVPHTMSREPRACHTRMCGCGKPFPLMCNTRTQVGAPNAQNCSFTATRRPVFGYNIIMLRRGELPGQFFGLKWG